MTIYNNNNLKSNYTQWKGFHHGQTRFNDQIAIGSGKTSQENRTKSSAEVLNQSFSPRFHPGTVIRYSGSATLLPGRLQRYRPIIGRSDGFTKSFRAEQSTALHHAPESSAKTLKKRAWHNLLATIFDSARAYGLIDESAEASIDSTGLESHFVSRHFLMRQSKRTKRYRKWTKLTVVCHNASHLIAGSVVSVGPSTDAPYLPEAVEQAIENLPIKRLLADAGYDSEPNHKLCREELGIRSTVIPVNNRRRKSGEPTGRYRRQMKNNFPKRKYRQRWQVESVFSRMKRRLGYALRARDEQARKAECLFRILAYNLMILYLLFKISVSINKRTLSS